MDWTLILVVLTLFVVWGLNNRLNEIESLLNQLKSKAPEPQTDLSEIENSLEAIKSDLKSLRKEAEEKITPETIKKLLDQGYKPEEISMEFNVPESQVKSLQK